MRFFFGFLFGLLLGAIAAGMIESQRVTAQPDDRAIFGGDDRSGAPTPAMS